MFPRISGDRADAPGTGDIAAAALIDHPGEGYYLITAGGFEECSPSLSALLNITAGCQTFARLTTALTAVSRDELATALDRLRGQHHPFRLIVQSSENASLLCRGICRFGENGAAEACVLWFSDISDREQQLQQLQQENEAMRAELAGLSATFNAAPMAMWRRDDTFAITYGNAAFHDLIEDQSDLPASSENLELHRKSKSLARQAREAGAPITERRHLIVGGHRKLFEITESPLANTTIAGFATSLDEVEAVSEELKRYIAAQGDLLESSVSAMAVFGRDMRLNFFNNAYARLWKLDEAFLESEPSYSEILEMLREKRRLPEQANFPMFKQQQTKRFTDLIEREEEFLYLPDGTSLRVVIIPHALGGLLFVYEDVTDKLALERSYNTLIAVQRATLDNLHQGVAVFEENGRLKLCNPVFRKLWQLDQAFTQKDPHISELLEETQPLYVFDDWATFKTAILGQLHTRGITYKRLERTDGSVIDWSCVPLPDGATLMTYYDVTDSTLVERSLREKNEALQESDRLKTQFLANVSYELRSPLTSIIGFSEVLKQHYFGALNPKQQEYLDGIHTSSQHLMNLINDILDLACIEAGYMTLELARFDIASVLTTVLSLVRERMREHGLTIEVRCSTRIGKMLGDETRIKQALFHLLSNAITYTPSGGTIVLGAEGDDETVRLWVEDSGIGIPPEEQQTVFEKFQRASNTGPLKSGTGLGLSIVENFIGLHGGKVELHSTVEVGTKVVCILPRNGVAA